jgi:hypothetical protein
MISLIRLLYNVATILSAHGVASSGKKIVSAFDGDPSLVLLSTVYYDGEIG